MFLPIDVISVLRTTFSPVKIEIASSQCFLTIARGSSRARNFISVWWEPGESPLPPVPIMSLAGLANDHRRLEVVEGGRIRNRGYVRPDSGPTMGSSQSLQPLPSYLCPCL